MTVVIFVVVIVIVIVIVVVIVQCRFMIVPCNMMESGFIIIIL